MKISHKQLPPLWVDISSLLFLGFFLVPLLVAQQIRGGGIQLGVSAFGLRLFAGEHPLFWVLAVDLTLFLGALTGLFIVTRRRFAYGFGVFYCTSTILVTVGAHIAVGADGRAAWTDAAIQYVLLLLFLAQLVLNRRRWIEQRGEQSVALKQRLAPSLQPARAAALTPSDNPYRPPHTET